MILIYIHLKNYPLIKVIMWKDPTITPYFCPLLDPVIQVQVISIWLVTLDSFGRTCLQMSIKLGRYIITPIRQVIQIRLCTSEIWIQDVRYVLFRINFPHFFFLHSLLCEEEWIWQKSFPFLDGKLFLVESGNSCLRTSQDFPLPPQGGGPCIG